MSVQNRTSQLRDKKSTNIAQQNEFFPSGTVRPRIELFADIIDDDEPTVAPRIELFADISDDDEPTVAPRIELFADIIDDDEPTVAPRIELFADISSDDDVPTQPGQSCTLNEEITDFDRTSQLRDKKSTNIAQQNVFFSSDTVKPRIELFADISDDDEPTQPCQSCTLNDKITDFDLTLPSQWTPNFNIRTGTYATVPSRSQMDTIFLSMSPIERVSTCSQCDYTTTYDEGNDCHNRTITDITLIDGLKGSFENSFVGSELECVPKRSRLHQKPSEMASGVSYIRSMKMSAEASNVLERLEESTKVINDQLLSLREDRSKHLTMARSITGPMDI